MYSTYPELRQPWLQEWQVRKVMAQFNMITLTSGLLHRAGTEGVGFNRDQLQLLGVPWPPVHGWLQRLIGTQIEAEVWETVLKLRGVRGRKHRQNIIAGNFTPTLL